MLKLWYTAVKAWEQDKEQSDYFHMYDIPYVLNLLCISQNAPVTGVGRRWPVALWGVLVSVIQVQDNVRAGRVSWESSVTNVRMDTGTWTDRQDVSPAAVILSTPSPTSATRSDLKLRNNPNDHRVCFHPQFLLWRTDTRFSRSLIEICSSNEWLILSEQQTAGYLVFTINNKRETHKYNI